MAFTLIQLESQLLTVIGSGEVYNRNENHGLCYYLNKKEKVVLLGTHDDYTMLRSIAVQNNLKTFTIRLESNNIIHQKITESLNELVTPDDQPLVTSEPPKIQRKSISSLDKMVDAPYQPISANDRFRSVTKRRLFSSSRTTSPIDVNFNITGVFPLQMDEMPNPNIDTCNSKTDHILSPVELLPPPLVPLRTSRG